jgi:hypothetical protein
MLMRFAAEPFIGSDMCFCVRMGFQKMFSLNSEMLFELMLVLDV